MLGGTLARSFSFFQEERWCPVEGVDGLEEGVEVSRRNSGADLRTDDLSYATGAAGDDRASRGKGLDRRCWEALRAFAVGGWSGKHEEVVLVEEGAHAFGGDGAEQVEVVARGGAPPERAREAAVPGRGDGPSRAGGGDAGQQRSPLDGLEPAYE